MLGSSLQPERTKHVLLHHMTIKKVQPAHGVPVAVPHFSITVWFVVPLLFLSCIWWKMETPLGCIGQKWVGFYSSCGCLFCCIVVQIVNTIRIQVHTQHQNSCRKWRDSGIVPWLLDFPFFAWRLLKPHEGRSAEACIFSKCKWSNCQTGPTSQKSWSWTSKFQ